MKITEKPNTYRTTNKKLLNGCHDRLINVHCRDHVTRQKSKQRHRSLKLADFHNQSPLLTMMKQNNSVCDNVESCRSASVAKGDSTCTIDRFLLFAFVCSFIA